MIILISLYIHSFNEINILNGNGMLPLTALNVEISALNADIVSTLF